MTVGDEPSEGLLHRRAEPCGLRGQLWAAAGCGHVGDLRHDGVDAVVAEDAVNGIVGAGVARKFGGRGEQSAVGRNPRQRIDPCDYGRDAVAELPAESAFHVVGPPCRTDAGQDQDVAVEFDVRGGVVQFAAPVVAVGDVGEEVARDQAGVVGEPQARKLDHAAAAVAGPHVVVVLWNAFGFGRGVEKSCGEAFVRAVLDLAAHVMQRFGEDGGRLLGERIARKAQPGRRLFLLFGDGGLASGRSGVEACRQCGEAHEGADDSFHIRFGLSSGCAYLLETGLQSGCLSGTDVYKFRPIWRESENIKYLKLPLD